METIKNLSVGIEEQETHISYMRDESYAKSLYIRFYSNDQIG